MSIATRSFDTPLGPITVTSRDGFIVAVDWEKGRNEGQDEALDIAEKAIRSILKGKAPSVLPPMAAEGTGFRKRVWAALQAIPFGSSLSYGALAKRLGTAPRAIGGACGANPIPILIPCHRVLGADGSLHGYDKKHRRLDRKAALLKAEGVAYKD